MVHAMLNSIRRGSPEYGSSSVALHFFFSCNLCLTFFSRHERLEPSATFSHRVMRDGLTSSGSLNADFWQATTTTTTTPLAPTPILLGS